MPFLLLLHFFFAVRDIYFFFLLLLRLQHNSFLLDSLSCRQFRLFIEHLSSAAVKLKDFQVSWHEPFATVATEDVHTCFDHGCPMRTPSLKRFAVDGHRLPHQGLQIEDIDIVNALAVGVHASTDDEHIQQFIIADGVLVPAN
jgi:hypothetical protein